MTSHIDVLILTNVVACAPCRNSLLLKEHDMAMFSTATLFWEWLCSRKGRIGWTFHDTGSLRAKPAQSWSPVTHPASSVCYLQIIKKPFIMILQNKKEVVRHVKHKEKGLQVVSHLHSHKLSRMGMTVIHASHGSPVPPVGLIPSEVSGGFARDFIWCCFFSEMFKFKSAKKPTLTGCNCGGGWEQD